MLHPHPPVLGLGHQPAPGIALLKLAQRPVGLAPVAGADLRQRPEPAGLVPAPRLGVLPLEALQRIGRGLQSSVLEREPAEEIVRLLGGRLAGEPLRDFLEPLHRLGVLVQLQQAPGAHQHRLGRRRRRARRSHRERLLRLAHLVEREQGLRPEQRRLGLRRAVAHQAVGLAPVELGQGHPGVPGIEEDAGPLQPLVQGQRHRRRRAAPELGVRIEGRLRPRIPHHERVEVRLGPEQVAERRSGLRAGGEQLRASQGPQRPLQEGEGLSWLPGAQQ